MHIIRGIASQARVIWANYAIAQGTFQALRGLVSVRHIVESVFVQACWAAA